MYLPDPNVKNLINTPNQVVTYDERGNPVMNRASITYANGAPVLAYDKIRGTNPYGSVKSAVDQAFDKWRKNKPIGGTLSRFDVKKRLADAGYDTNGLTWDELLALYQREMSASAPSTAALGRVTGYVTTKKK